MVVVLYEVCLISLSAGVPSMGSEVPLVDLIDKLGVEVMSSRSKNPVVLYLAAQCCRAMAGKSCWVVCSSSEVFCCNISLYLLYIYGDKVCHKNLV